MGVTVVVRGNFNRTEKFLAAIKQGKMYSSLDKCGEEGVRALSSATPFTTGATANAWSYEIHKSKGTYSIVWTNTHINKGVNIAVILQYGHGTRNGGYVEGQDYINPAMRPIFKDIADKAWKAVTSL
jgi:hypothetical protein